ncbi:MAG: hypothetical protein IT431_05805 [Phycisphaerales bacterium]|nr:hypothetical protein [Phycisphaerales bacterium]
MNSPLNRAVVPGKFSLDLDSLPYELRVYLWAIYASYDRMAYCTFWRDPGRWPSLKVWRHVLGAFRTTLISYNYECLAEYATAACGYHPVNEPDRNVLQVLDAFPSEVPVIKPHGSITHYSPGGLWFETADHWRNRLRLLDCTSDPFASSAWPPTAMPVLPDLVPPGHAGDRLCNPQTDVHQAIRSALGDSDLVVVWGLSGNPPDDMEVRSHFRSIPGSSRCYYIGFDDNDRMNPAYKALLATGAEVGFLRASMEGPFVLTELDPASFVRRSADPERTLVEMAGGQDQQYDLVTRFRRLQRRDA